MPFVTVDYLAGPGPDQKRRLQQQVARVVMEIMDAPATNVRVFLRSFDSADVYCADENHEVGLPVIRAEFLEGRSYAQKQALAAGLARAAAESLAVPVERIRTILYERAKTEWARGADMVADS